VSRVAKRIVYLQRQLTELTGVDPEVEQVRCITLISTVGQQVDPLGAAQERHLLTAKATEIFPGPEQRESVFLRTFFKRPGKLKISDARVPGAG
jgi:hypothetical protein